MKNIDVRVVVVAIIAGVTAQLIANWIERRWVRR